MNAQTPSALNPLAQAAFESSFAPINAAAGAELSRQARAASIVVFVEPPHERWGGGFFFFLVGSIPKKGGAAQDPNAVTQALAASARAGLYSEGFGPPANPLNDYPSASFLLSADIACSQIALSAPSSLTREQAIFLAQASSSANAQALFGPRRALSRAARMGARSGRCFDALANEAIASLRSLMGLAR